MYLKRPVGWWIGPPKRRAWGAKYAARGGMALLLLLGLLANLTVIGSVEPLGIVPFSSWMARSASMRWSNLMNPTPLDRPARTIGFKLLAPETDRHLPWLLSVSFKRACACSRQRHFCHDMNTRGREQPCVHRANRVAHTLQLPKRETKTWH